MHRSATFTFDRVLYRDRFLHVTSSRVVIGGRFPFARARAIDTAHINCVRVDPCSAKPFVGATASRRAPLSLSALSVGKRGAGRESVGRIVLCVEANPTRPIRLRAENAADAARAIRAGMSADMASAYVGECVRVL